jgi:hypothetical protein
LADGSIGTIAWNLARNLLGIYVGTAAIVGYGFTMLLVGSRFVYGAAALAILIPPNTFAGANILDWIGLGVAGLVVTIDYVRSRSRPVSVASQVASHPDGEDRRALAEQQDIC